MSLAKFGIELLVDPCQETHSTVTCGAVQLYFCGVWNLCPLPTHGPLPLFSLAGLGAGTSTEQLMVSLHDLKGLFQLKDPTIPCRLLREQCGGKAPTAIPRNRAAAQSRQSGFSTSSGLLLL